jgi:putative membrane protein
VAQRSYTFRMTPDPDAPLRAMLWRFAINLLGLWLASKLVSGIHIGDWQSLLVGAVCFAFVNMLLKPLATFVSCCLIAATFGLFVLVINAVMLEVAAWAASQVGMNFTVADFGSAFFGALVISVVSIAASWFTPGVIRGR